MMKQNYSIKSYERKNQYSKLKADNQSFTEYECSIWACVLISYKMLNADFIFHEIYKFDQINGMILFACVLNSL